MALSQDLRVPRELEAGFPLDAATASIGDAPAVRAVDEIFDAALAALASDVHVEPAPGGGRVRLRVDGALRASRALPEPLFAQVLSRIKLLAGMDIADRRLPQDGRYTLTRAGSAVDARVASLPTVDGEKLVVRLLATHERALTLDSLGMPAQLAALYRAACASDAGFSIVCGPTGSGKTTTAYATLAERNVEGANLCSVEDPVERRLPGVAQVQVNARAGLTFASAVRAFLRQDPDAVFVGETRDAETAAAVVTAALSGHFVLTTLHSASALGAVERLLDLGLPARRAANALTAVLSQRLLRRLCTQCRVVAGRGGFAANGCDRCEGTGYRGRVAAFELVCVDETLRAAIVREASYDELDAACRSRCTIDASCRALVANGETSEDECARVLGEMGG